jgi:indole-3-glycerol phosphate synthase
LKALQYPAVIAEIKRRSPRKGLIHPIPDPIELANLYELGGATALSVLTDEKFFGAQPGELAKISEHLKDHPVAILRKDFIISEMQIIDSYLNGADAILAIVAVLGENTARVVHFAHELALEVIVEVHDEAELEIAVNSGTRIIGVNNRNLETFEIDPERSFQLLPDIPDHIIAVAESGINHPEEAHAYFDAGFHAVLIGEALVKSNNPIQFVRACRYDESTH